MDNPKHAAAAADESGASNKRGKHAHEGPHSIAQVEEEEKQSSVAAAPARASPIGRLYADALGEIFDFLTLSELSRALAVSPSWSAIIRTSMPCARFTAWCTAEWLVTIGSSALARHITGIEHSSTARCKLPSDSLCVLALAMPQLLALQCDVTPSAAIKMILPAKLKTLDMDLTALNADGINRAVEAIGQLAALSHLTLVLPSWLRGVSFVPLSKCAALEALIVQPPPNVACKSQPTDVQVDQLRALHQLRGVTIPQLNASSLKKLLRLPHSLQWTELRELSNVDVVGAAALRNLPSLLTLDTWACRDVSFLPALSHLQWLKLEVEREPWAVTGDAVVKAVSSCRQLTILTLVAPVTCAHLTRLLLHLAQLHSLILSLCSELESLAFLSAVPSLQRTLRVFALEQCIHPALRSSELSHVVTLKQLAALHLIQSFADPLDGFTQRLLTPPSSMLPQLTAFKFAAPTAASAALP